MCFSSEALFTRLSDSAFIFEDEAVYKTFISQDAEYYVGKCVKIPKLPQIIWLVLVKKTVQGFP